MRTLRRADGHSLEGPGTVGRHASRSAGRWRRTAALGWAAATALSAALAVPASAADFTVNVPIEIKTLPSGITKGKVQCDARDQSRTVMIGLGTVQFDIVGGTYTGTAVVTFNADAGRDPAQAAEVGCGLWISTGGGTWFHPSMLGDGTGVDWTKPFKEVTTVAIPKP